MTLALVAVAAWIGLSVLVAVLAGPLMAACDRPAPRQPAPSRPALSQPALRQPPAPSQPLGRALTSARGSSAHDLPLSLRGGHPAYAPFADGRTEAQRLPA
jgi:hypothetical protein